jgi:DNA repair exonuclease SbcCD ATPase subunit
MDTDKRDEEIARQVEVLKAQGKSTRELYQDVAGLLFFEFDITPTVNRLYKAVGKGSMSVPTEALRMFWREVREKYGRLRLEHVDLPGPMIRRFEELASATWQVALEHAEQARVHHRSSLEAHLSEAGVRIRELERLNVLLARERDSALEAQTAADAAAAHAKAVLSENMSQISALQSQVQGLQAANARLVESERALRADFQETLAQLRADFSAAQQRVASEERRVKLEMDAERQAGVRLRKENDKLIQKANDERNALMKELGACQQSALGLTRRIGELEGALAELRRREGSVGEPDDSSRAKSESVRARAASRKRT